MILNERLFRYADLLYQEIKGKISKDDKEELKEWMKENEQNRKLNEVLKQTLAFRGKEDKYRLFDKYYNYKSLHRRIVGKKRKRIFRYSAVAASVCIPLLLLLIYGKPQTEENKISLTRNNLLPGKSMATLLLEDGSIKRLEEENFVIASGNVVALNQNHQLSYHFEHSDPGNQIENYHSIVVPRGGEYYLELSDRSRIWLNSESTIRFPVVFRGNERKVEISGEVYMEIARDTTRPFIVKTRDFDVRVLGTRFNIQAYRDEMCTTATLAEGKIEVMAPAGESYLLNLSEQLYYNKKQQEYRIKKVDVDLYTSWKDGWYIFRKQSLENVLSTISRWYDLQVFYVNPDVKDITFSGRVKRYENADVLLALFERLGGVKFDISEKTVIVRKE